MRLGKLADVQAGPVGQDVLVRLALRRCRGGGLLGGVALLAHFADGKLALLLLELQHRQVAIEPLQGVALPPELRPC